MAPNFVRRRMSRIAFAAVGLVLGGMIAFQPVQTAQAQGPVSVADLAENLADAVVNISTAQTVQGRRSVPISGSRMSAQRSISRRNTSRDR